MATSASTEIKADGFFFDVGWDEVNIGLFAFAVVNFSAFIVAEFWFGLPYSKFAKEDAISAIPIRVLRSLLTKRIDSRLGWIIVYSSPAVTYAALFASFASYNKEKIGKIAPNEFYSLVLLVGWEMNFIKRVLECAFLHVYSDTLPVLTVIMVAFGYSSAGLLALFFSNQVDADIDVIAPGSTLYFKNVVSIFLFVVFMSGNFYAHLRLKEIRTENSVASTAGQKRYYSLQELGCLFQVLVCPHYVFEIGHFSAWSVFGATAGHYLVGATIFSYLGLRTRSSYQWYKAKGLIKKSTSTGTSESEFKIKENENEKAVYTPSGLKVENPMADV